MARPVKETGKPVPGFTNSFRARLEEVISRIGGPQAAVDLTGGSIDQLASWRLGRSRPDFFALARLCEAAGETVDWLAKGEGPRDIQPRDHIFPSSDGTKQERAMGGMVQSQQLAGVQDGMVLLPYLNVQASAGQGIVPADEEIREFLAFKEEFLRKLGINPRNAHVLQIKGDSMYPTFRDHDVIVIDASLIDVREEGLYTLVYDDAVFAKRIQPLRDGTLRIVSDNKAAGYVDEIVPASERHTLKIVGRIRGVYRNL